MLVASSLRFGAEPIHCTAYDRAFAPASMSLRSVMPYQFRIAAIGGTALSKPVNPPPEQILVNPAEAGAMAAIRARWPPADSPVTTMRDLSMLNCLAWAS